VAVLRVITAMPADTLDILREEIDFLDSIGAHGARSEMIRKR
jgi:hypothetical protein